MACVFGEINPDRPFRRSAKKAEKEKESNHIINEIEEKETETKEEEVHESFKENNKEHNELKNYTDRFQEIQDEKVKETEDNFSNVEYDSDSLKSIVKFAEEFLGKKDKDKEVRNKIEKIVDNFSRADKKSLWETYINTEKEISPFGGYYQTGNKLPYCNYEQESAEKSFSGIGLFLLLILILFQSE
jgi:hypothetical protein